MVLTEPAQSAGRPGRGRVGFAACCVTAVVDLTLLTVAVWRACDRLGLLW